jgi:predicted P-loop ATPase/GTPase
MTLLVAGGDRVDAGKTTFAAGLLAWLRDRGAAAVGFKPRAGNDWWFDHGDVRAALSGSALHGKDVRRLAAAGAGEQRPGALNPLHRLWRPTPGETGLLGEAGRTFLVDRLATAEGASFVVNGAAEDDGHLPDAVREALPLADAARVDDVPTFNEVMESRYLPAFDRLRDRVERAPRAVVESYADVAAPLSGVSYDAVAVVDPGRARVYDGGRYGRAVQVASGGPRDGRLEERVGDVVSMVDPVATVALPALSDPDPETVASAYAPAYGELVAG